MSYTVIAQENILMANAASSGSKEERTFVILERFSDEVTVTEIGISGDPLFVMGSRGNDMFFPFNPIQIQFSIVDQFGLLAKFTNRNKKDFKLQVKIGETVEYELYLYLPSNNTEYFETDPEIDLVATNGIGLLKREYFQKSDTTLELKDFILECRNRLGFDLDVEFYSSWKSSNNSLTFPLGYRLNRSYQIRFKNAVRYSFYEILERFCTQFNLQLYQTSEKWILIERKQRLDAPIDLQGIDLTTGLDVTNSFRSALNADKVLRKPKKQFKPGLNELKTIFKIADDYFINDDLSESRVAKNLVPGWSLEPDPGAVEVHSDIDGLYVQLNRSPDNDIEEGWIRQRGKRVLVNNSEQVDTIELSFDLSIEALTDVNTFGDVYSINYLRVRFYSLDGFEYILNNDLSWEVYVTDDPSRFSQDVPEGSNIEINSSFNIQPPTGKIGYLDIEYRLHDTGAQDPIQNTCLIKILHSSIEFNTGVDRSKKLFINSRGVLNPNASAETYGQGDIDEYGNLFVYEYFDTNDEWVIADYINNEASVKSIFEVAPYQRLCQANKDQIEYSTIGTWKYLYPDFLATIVLERETEPDLYTIPIEVKWNMVTGELEIFSVEAFEDTTGVTRLAFYSEEEYEELDPETVITDEGELVYGFTKGADSADDRGFEVEFEAPDSVTANTAVIEVGGVNYELDTLILEN